MPHFQLSVLLAAGAAAYAAAAVVSVPEAWGASESVVYSFQGGASDGRLPNGGLLFFGGKLYGTTLWGGSGENCNMGFQTGCGTAFALTLDGAETVLHQFGQTEDDGAYPMAGMVEMNGTLYGTTASGVSLACPDITHGGCGTVFSLSVTGTETVLHAFQWFYATNGVDGAFPSKLTKRGHNLYGTTGVGGTGGVCDQPNWGCGTVFKITPKGDETQLYSFEYGPDGFTPRNGLATINGTFYGLADSDLGNGNELVYSVTPDGAQKVIYAPAGSGSFAPNSLVAFNGVLYGTTQKDGANGLGTVFMLTTDGSYTLLHSFAGGSDGANPTSIIRVGGKLYGTTQSGGAQNDGTVFQVSKTGVESVVYSFQGGSDGADPAGLIDVQGVFYGTTQGGGAFASGTVFRLTP